MKKFLILLSLIFISFYGNTQSFYKVTNTELYLWNEESEEWKLYQKLSDLSINLCVEEEFVTIFAKSPSMYKIYNTTKTDISTKTLIGNRYVALDLKKGVEVKIDIMRLRENANGAMLSVVNSKEGFNQRFFLVVE